MTKTADTSVCPEIKTCKNDLHQGPSKTHHREHYLICAALMMRCYRLHNLPIKEYQVMFLYFTPKQWKKDLRTNWEHVEMSGLIHSSRENI